MFDQWFAITGDWLVTGRDNTGITKEYNYIYDRSIIYDFHVLE